jgi:hypothetical protein
MNATVEDLRATIIPKSDQLNADQLVTGPMDITVTDVRIGSADQPVIVHYEGDGGRPFKPCKTMRRVLIMAWGENGRNWIGRSMRLYHAPEVKFGGAAVGGIRISHMTDIPRDINVSLSEAKGKKAMHTIRPMQPPAAGIAGAVRMLQEATSIEDLKATFGTAYKATKDAGTRGRLKVAYDARLVVLTACESIEAADSEEAARDVLAEALAKVPAESHAALQAAFDMAWTSPDPDTTTDNKEPA